MKIEAEGQGQIHVIHQHVSLEVRHASSEVFVQTFECCMMVFEALNE